MFLFLLLLNFVTIFQAPGGQSVTLAWDSSPSPEVTGYRVYYGTDPSNLTNRIDAGKSTQISLEFLFEGQRYYFAATAYNSAGIESSRSGNVAFTTVAISQIQRESNGSAQVTIIDNPGDTDNLYASNDLENWTLISSTQNSNGTLVVADSNAQAASSRFYKVSNSVITTDPSGYVTLRIAGQNNGQNSFSFIGVSALNPVSYEGTLTGVGKNTIVDSNACWTNDQFDGGNGHFFVEIISGPHAGVMSNVVGTSGTTKILTTADDLSTLLAGNEQFRVRKHQTIANVFGGADEIGLQGAPESAAADEVRIFDPAQQQFSVYYYQTGASGGTGWRSATDASTDASQTILYPDSGVMIVRKTAGNLASTLAGNVKLGPTQVPIAGTINLAANLYPAGQLTLGRSNLYVGNANQGLAGAQEISLADEVYLFNGNSFIQYYYKTGGSGGTGWRSGTDAISDASGTQIAPGTALYIIRKAGRPPFTWTIPQPF
ncbi:MAG: hypothetical protein JOY96_04765 [Verrucomicrobia bacterium]|nr:hypothetical protein [Verrucomicrobiota bacterium]